MTEIETWTYVDFECPYCAQKHTQCRVGKKLCLCGAEFSIDGARIGTVKEPKPTQQEAIERAVEHIGSSAGRCMARDTIRRYIDICANGFRSAT